jgi:PKD repeat protein
VTDPSSVDTAAGFTYAWRVTKNGAAFASGTGTTLIFTPDDNANYAVNLTATDKDGGTSPVNSSTILVDNVVPTASITGAPSSSTPNSVISLGSTVTDPSSVDTAAGFTYAWSVTKDGAAFASGNTANFSFIPDTAATYVVTLTATDKDGGTGTASQTIQVGTPTGSTAPAPVHYDFGVAGSPVATGYTQATASMTYNIPTGYGWLRGSIDGRDRGAGSDLTRDFALTSDGTFGVSMVNGSYQVTLTMGDVSYPYDQMGIFLQGTQVDTVSTLAGQSLSKTYTVSVSTAQLQLEVKALGGAGSLALINGLDLTPVTLTGPTAVLANGGSVNEGSTAVVTFTSPSGGSGSYTYSYDFNSDGTFEVSNSTSSQAVVPASFLDDGPGARIVHGRITDSSGSFTDYTTSIPVNNVAPTAAPGGPYSSFPNFTIIFTGSATDPSPADTAAGFTYAWDFGDGSTGSGLSPSHAYAATGTYTVTLTVTDKNGGKGSATTTAAIASLTASTGPMLLPPSELATLQQAAAANTPQWQAFKAQLDKNLNVVIEGGYQGSEVPLISDYALAYQILKDSDPTTASKYADKAIAIMKSGLNDYQKGYWSTQQFLARGNGTTTSFTLPNADYDPSTVKIFLANTTTTAVTHGAANGQDPVNYYAQFLKASNTPDGAADYAQGADWAHNPNLANNLIDWSPAGKEPASGATYYVTWITGLGDTLVDHTNYSLSGTTLTLATAPSANQAVMVEYLYGTHATNGSTLAYQQTSAGDGGFNSILIDSGYTSRYLGKHIAMGLDWLDGYAGFSSTLKTQAMTTLVRWSDYLSNNGFYYSSPASNYGAGEYVSHVLTALALVNRDPTNGPRLMSEVLNYRQNNVLPLLQNATSSLNGGFWAEGWNYGVLATQNVLLGGLALEENGWVPGASAERAWASQVIEHLVSAQPTPSTAYDGGDWFAYPTPFPGKELFDVLGTMADNAADRSYANYILQNYPGSNTNDHVDLLFHNPSAAASFWSSQPLQNFARGTGLLTARSDWGNTPTWMSLQIGNLLNADHQSYTPGQLEIQRGGDALLINAAVKGGFQTAAAKSQYGNTLIVDDNGDGVQTYRYSMGYWYSSPGVYVDHYEAGNNYVYLSGNYAAAYSSNLNPGAGGPVSELTRQVVYLQPNEIVVYDRVTTIKDTYLKAVQWNFLNAPTVSGNSFVETVGGSKLFGREYSTVPITTSVVPVQVGDATVQEMRTQNATPTASVRYVTAFQVAPSGTSSMVSTQQVLSADSRMEGVQMGNQLVLFGRNGDVDLSTPVTYQINSSSAVQHLLVNLKAGKTYKVYVNGTLTTTLAASSQGTLSFTTSTVGAQTIQVST